MEHPRGEPGPGTGPDEAPLPGSAHPGSPYAGSAHAESPHAGSAQRGERAPAVAVRGFSVATGDGCRLAACDGLTAEPGSITGLIGPSGSGKTTLLRAMVGALPGEGCTVRGDLTVLGQRPLRLAPGELRRFRRHRVAFVGQDPASRLNPRTAIGRLLTETAAADSPSDVREAVREALAQVGLPADGELLRRRPGELSGGQQRRVAIARALTGRPELLLLDEPTAGLDPALRDRLAELLHTLADDHGTAVVFSSHDPELAGGHADRVVRMAPSMPADARADAPAEEAEKAAEAGEAEKAEEIKKAEETEPVRPDGATPAVIRSPAAAGAEREAELPASEREFLRVEVQAARMGTRHTVSVLRNVSLGLARGSALAVAGESGAGKTTLGRVITGLHRYAEGEIRLGDRQLPLRARRNRRLLGQVQLVPQDPLGTLNPARTVAATLARPLRTLRRLPRAELTDEIAALLASVRLPAEFAGRYPHELSGGQRQRVAIARALAAGPKVLVCDEITSSLDPRTAAEVMDLLDETRRTHGLSLVVISHQLPLAARYCERTLVLHEGAVVEHGSTEDVLRSPSHPAASALVLPAPAAQPTA
ncbi:ABC transporter ATP-binding protein [Streptomyces sp. HNM0575]|uniref:ABC transporter ATP-binding protein n=1 Tax=Streptomyces sp. HNM0575 TaxID=2716338 RepID=UPI00145F26E3|nr:ATP-binding cassette domain-containing protein [Streptomyces sp. HNM0575]NLU75584.1 ABC transporter ATP-binding protein [Streptomyces sp. HNM0575]